MFNFLGIQTSMLDGDWKGTGMDVDRKGCSCWTSFRRDVVAGHQLEGTLLLERGCSCWTSIGSGQSCRKIIWMKLLEVDWTLLEEDPTLLEDNSDAVAGR